jgi:alkylated DNA repair dioxygenase AlkB
MPAQTHTRKKPAKLKRRLITRSGDYVVKGVTFTYRRSHFKNGIEGIKKTANWKEGKCMGRIMPRKMWWLTLGEVQGNTSYRFGSASFQAETVNSGEIHDIAEELRNTFGMKSNSCFVNLYEGEKSSVNWHADNEKCLGSTKTSVITSVSLGQRRKFLVKPVNAVDGDERMEFHLGEGDVLIMGAGCQEKFIHCVPKQKGKSGERINITYREAEFLLKNKRRKEINNTNY